jgi:hypothetical protein
MNCPECDKYLKDVEDDVMRSCDHYYGKYNEYHVYYVVRFPKRWITVWRQAPSAYVGTVHKWIRLSEKRTEVFELLK